MIRKLKHINHDCRWTHVDNLLSVLVDCGEVWPWAVSLRKQSQTYRNFKDIKIMNRKSFTRRFILCSKLISCSDMCVSVTDVITLKYCTLSSSAPDSTEELMRHNGSPLESETRKSPCQSQPYRMFHHIYRTGAAPWPHRPKHIIHHRKHNRGSEKNTTVYHRELYSTP